MTRPLIIGQAPGARSDPAQPLAGRCGARLADLAGLDLPTFLATFERINLIDRFPGKTGKGDTFPRAEAGKTATRLIIRGAFLRRRVVFLGENVTATFGFKHAVFEPLRFYQSADSALAFCPHPSSINRWWNDPQHVEAARRFWTTLVQEPGLEWIRR